MALFSEGARLQILQYLELPFGLQRLSIISGAYSVNHWNSPARKAFTKLSFKVVMDFL